MIKQNNKMKNTITWGNHKNKKNSMTKKKEAQYGKTENKKIAW